jgi:hypothetical protein
MRKKVLTLKAARPAIENLIRDMKKKYSGREVQFKDITMASDDFVNNNLPTTAKNYLTANPNNIRKKGTEQGITFYYYKLKTQEGSEIYILPIMVFFISRSDNSGAPTDRLLVCSLDTYLPKITNEDINEIDTLLESVIKR